MAFEQRLILIAIMLTLCSITSGAESIAFQCIRQESTKCIIPNVVVTDISDEILLPDLSNKTTLQIKSGNLSFFDEKICSQLGSVEILHLGMLGIKELLLQAQLVEVKAASNEIAKISFASDEDYKLQFLDLAGNRLSSVEDFERLNNLVELNLRGNLLTEVKFETFANMEALKTLILAENQLKTIQTTSQVSLPELTFLSLAGNKLDYLNVSNWDFESLMTLEVSSNQLIKIDSIDDHFPSLSHVSLAANSWYCTWLEELLKNFTTNSVTLTDKDTNCIGPSDICCIPDIDTNLSYDESFQRLEKLEKNQSKVQHELQTKIEKLGVDQNQKLTSLKNRLEELFAKDSTMVSIAASETMDKDGFVLLRGKVDNLKATVEDEVEQFRKRNDGNTDIQRKLGFAIVELRRSLAGETKKLHEVQAQFNLLKEYALKNMPKKNGW